jgi:hypothetical protein
MADTILADYRRPATTDQDHQEARRAAIRQRTTRGLLTFNTGKVHHLEGDLWAVPSTRGGFHQVDLGTEECECEDFTFYGRDHDVACRHIYAAAIANAARRARRRRGATTTCEVCGVSSYEKTLIGLRNDRRRNGPRYCLPHHPDSLATVVVDDDVRL